MPVYFVTGKLGSGKTLIAVRRIQEYLQQGRLVATNIDVNLESMCKVTNKAARVIRVPDKPTADDMQALGAAYEGDYDENKFGLVVLDELGTWLNSRSWNDKTRSKFIDWLIHARKLKWDIIFLVQNIEMVDKQVKDALCEYLVVCRRLDRIKFMGINLPKIHSASVYYGHSENPKLLEEKWRYQGKDLYTAYDTSQVFSPFYDSGLHSVLPPGYTVVLTPEQLKQSRKNEMIARSSPIFGVLLIIGLIVTSLYFYNRGDTGALVAGVGGSRVVSSVEVDVAKIKASDTAGTYEYEGYIQSGEVITYFLNSSHYGRLSSAELEFLGGTVFRAVGCTASIKWVDGSVTVASCKNTSSDERTEPRLIF